MRSLPWILASASAALLAACTTPYFTMPPGPEGFRIGYYDGCDAGYSYAGSPFYAQSDVMDPPATAKEPYATGWRAGFEKCAGKYERVQRAVNLLLGP